LEKNGVRDNWEMRSTSFQPEGSRPEKIATKRYISRKKIGGEDRDVESTWKVEARGAVKRKRGEPSLRRFAKGRGLGTKRGDDPGG